MSNFLGNILDRIENTGSAFSENAYGVVASDIAPLLKVAFVCYVGIFGIQVLLGIAQISGREIVLRITRMLIILSLVQNWGNFDALFYSWLSNTPEQVGRAILSATGSGVSEPTGGLTEIWRTANLVAAAFARQSGFTTFLPSLIGFAVMIATGFFIGAALFILILAKVMMWVLIGTAPIFISCMLFEPTRNLGTAWFQQVLLYALHPLFVYVLAAFLITGMSPELLQATAAVDSDTLKLSDISGFLLLSIAGAFVLLNIQSLAQGITGGMAVGVGGFARAAVGFPTGLAMLAVKKGVEVGWNRYRGRNRGNSGNNPPEGGTINRTDDPAASSLKSRIKARSLPN